MSMINGLYLSGVVKSVLADEQQGGLPWWAWLLIILIVALLVLFLWWWLGRSKEKEELPAQAAPPVVTKAPPPVVPTPAVQAPVAPAAVAQAPIAPAPVVQTPVIPLPPPTPVEPDDLTVVEGIGPKIASVLQSAGIVTFKQLAGADIGLLDKTLKDAGLHLADPGTWAQQARLAAEDKWDELKVLQDNLKGGRSV